MAHTSNKFDSVLDFRSFRERSEQANKDHVSPSASVATQRNL